MQENENNIIPNENPPKENEDITVEVNEGKNTSEENITEAVTEAETADEAENINTEEASENTVNETESEKSEENKDEDVSKCGNFNSPSEEKTEKKTENQPYMNGAPQAPYYTPYGNYPPYRNYPPYGYPPVIKKKLNSPAKVFIILLAVLYGISSFAMFGGLAYSVIKAKSEAAYDDYQDYLDKYEEFEDYYGQFEDFFGEGEGYPDFGNKDNDKDKDTENRGETEEYVQPDIDFSPYTDGITINSKPEGEPLSAEEVYNKVILSTVSVNAEIPLADGTYEPSSGTGIIITEDGFIITNAHVIGNTKSTIVKVITHDGTEHPAIIAAFDKATDLAVLKIDADGLTPAEFGNDEELNIGEWVIAIGSPGGVGFSGSLTRGVISGLDRVIDTTETSNITYIQTDAVINPGNSGGPLVNMYGQVVGINTSKIAAEAYEGMGFSIPTTDAKEILDQLLASGYVNGRVRVGITGQNNVYGNPYGVIIIEFDETGSSFDGTLAKVNDIIIGMDGKTIQSLADLTTALQKYKAGNKAKVTLYRPATGKEITVEITLLPDEGETQR